MKKLFKIFLALNLFILNCSVKAEESLSSDDSVSDDSFSEDTPAEEVSDEESPESNHPIDKEGYSKERVCESCIPMHAVKGEIFEVNDQYFRLDYYDRNKNDWYMSPVKINNKEVPQIPGKSVDETFEKGADTGDNDKSMRWMNQDFTSFDRTYSRGSKGTEARQSRERAFNSLDQEAQEVMQSIDQTIVEADRFIHGNVIENDYFHHQVTLDLLSGITIPSSNVAEANATVFFQNIYSHLPNLPSSNYRIEYLDEGGSYIDTAPYLSSHKEYLESLRSRLNSFKTQGPQQWDAKLASFASLRSADYAYLHNQESTGDRFLSIAKSLADIATDIIPFTSIPKDTYRALIGKDPLTGELLSSFERVLSAGFAVAAVGSLGLSNALKVGMKETQILARASHAEVALAENLTKIIKGSPLRVEVLVKGSKNEFTLIGRDMNRVALLKSKELK